MPTYLSYNADLLRYVLDVGVYNNTVNIPKRIIPTGDTGRGRGETDSLCQSQSVCMSRDRLYRYFEKTCNSDVVTVLAYV